jgi:molybdate transport system permease protein
MPLAIYSALQAPGGEVEAERLSLISIVLALIFMTLAEVLQRRARERA